MSKSVLYILLSLSTCLIHLMGESPDTKGIRPEFLRVTCEGNDNPIGLDIGEPLFSWVMENNGFQQSQSAFRLLVATSPELLKPGKADMWDSKKQKTKESVHQKYSGKNLNSTTRYWWTVRMWNQDDQPSKWSDPHFFEMGLLEESDWEDSQWLSLTEDTRKSEFRIREKKTERMKQPEETIPHPAGYFRTNFEVTKKVKSARAYICGLGYYELYLNGKKVGDHVLDPAPTSYDKRSLYVTYDITKQLQRSANTVGVILGNGFYGQNLAFTQDLSYGKPAFRLLINVEYTDGTTSRIISTENWKANTGPIVFDNPYGGETYDSRFELPGWSLNNFNDAGWQDAQVVRPEVKQIAAQAMPPSKRTKVLPPVDIFRGANGNWILDFGQVLAGWIKLQPKGNAGTAIAVRTTEALTQKGDAIHPGSLGKTATGWNQEDIYVCNGNDSGFWEPRFTYNSFRYAEIEGLAEKPTAETVQAIMVNTDLKKTGSFVSSSPLLNRMVEMSEWTVLDNFHGYPEDCPAREKCGWLGDAHATAQFNLYNYDITQAFEKYSHDISSQLLEKPGKFSQKERTFRVPTMIAPGNRIGKPAELDWGIAQIYVPWYVYLHTGHSRSLEDYYPEMKEVVEYYLTFKNKDGILETGQGDWCPPLWDRQGRFDGPMECHPHVSANAYFYDILNVMIRAANMMQDRDFIDFLKTERDALLEAFNQAYLVQIGDDGKLWYGSQTATVMALQFGLVPEEKRDAVINGLLHDIVEVKGGHHSTGIHGNRYLYTLLNDLGYEDLSYSVLTHPEFPSQGYIVNAGLTTWPERQWEWASGIEWDRSLNHPMQAGFTALFYESVAGIKPNPDNPGFSTFTIEPTFWEELEYAGAHIESPYGRISSHWKRSEHGIMLEVQIPFNSEALIRLPANAEVKSILGKDGTDFSNFQKSNSKILLGSGSYSITF